MDGFKSKEKTSIKTIDTKFWIKSKEIKDLNQDLKIIEEGSVVKQIKAKGESNINTFINTYLIEYVITKFNIPKEIMLLTIPSKEKISKESSFIEITEFNLVIRVEKEMGKLYIFSPICLIVLENSELI